MSKNQTDIETDSKDLFDRIKEETRLIGPNPFGLGFLHLKMEYMSLNQSPEKFKELINQKNQQGDTILHAAAKLKKWKNVKYILSQRYQVDVLTHLKKGDS